MTKTTAKANKPKPTQKKTRRNTTTVKPKKQKQPVKQASKLKRQVVENLALKQQTKAVSEILLATILPGEGKSMRLPFQADQKTAVVDWEVDAVKQCGGEAEINGATVSVGRTQVLVMTGQAGVPWLESKRVSGWMFGMGGDSYKTLVFSNFKGGTNATGSMHIDYFSGRITDVNGIRDVVLPTVEGAAFANVGQPFNSARQRAAYVPGGARPYVVQQCTGLTINALIYIVVTAVRYDDRGRPIEVITFPSMSTTFAPAGNFETYTKPLSPSTTYALEAGFYQFYFSVSGGEDVAGIYSVGMALGPSNGAGTATAEEKLWPSEALMPITPPRLNTLEDPYTAARITSCALLASNATNMLNIEGSVQAARLDAQAYFPSSMSSATRTRAREAIAAKRYFGLLKDGAYMFCPLETLLLQYRDYVQAGRVDHPLYSQSSVEGIQIWEFHAELVPAVQNVPIYHAGLSVPFSVMYLTDNGGINAPGATTMNLRLEMHVEYRTDNPQLTLGLAHGEQADLLLAQQILATLPYFYENPTHWERVMQRLRAAWSTIRPYAPQLMLGAGRAASAAFPEFSPIINAASAMGAMRLR